MTRSRFKELARDIERFVEFKRSLGHSYRRGVFILRSFERYAKAHADASKPLDWKALIHGWLARIDQRKPISVSTEFGVIRQLCLYRRRSDPAAFVPMREWMPWPGSDFLPFIFSRKQVIELLRAAESLPGPRFHGLTMKTLLLVLYCTGLRPGEAVRLQRNDVDLQGKILTVRESKGRTRLVPFRSDLRRELAKYVQERQQVVREGGYGLFVQPNGEPYSVQKACNTLRLLLRQAGLKPPKGRVGPRPYDFRHTFAVHRLTQWYRAGVDIHARLPWLSAYMGHDNILGTEVYLTATPELLGIAGRRFHARFRCRLRRQS